MTQVWREAIDHCMAQGHRYAPKTHWMASLDQVAEGQQHTLGAYHRPGSNPRINRALSARKR